MATLVREVGSSRVAWRKKSASSPAYAAGECRNGRLETILLTHDWVKLVFGECLLYRPQASARYELDACRAELGLRDVRQLKIEGVIDNEAAISDCRILCSSKPAAPSALLAGIGQ